MQYFQKHLALGSDVQLYIISDMNRTGAEQLFKALWKQIFVFERQFSRFLPASELSLFNRNAGIKQPASPEFTAILRAAKHLGQETEGLYNPFILPALQAAGYDHSMVKGYENDPQDDHSHKSVASVDKLEIGEDWARIPYGTALDLGGCGKGYLADQLADSLPRTGITGYWFSLGGDIAAGGTNEAGEPWQIAIQRATGEGADDIGSVSLPGTGKDAVASSGVTHKRGVKNGTAWHHLIDPRTLRPAQTDVLLATVRDKSALRADVLASCAAILSAHDGLAFLQKHSADAALIQYGTHDGIPATLQFGKGINKIMKQ